MSLLLARRNAPTTGPGTADSLPLPPRITPATVIGGLILIAGAITLGLVGIRRVLIQTFISVSLLAAVCTTLLIDYVMKPPISDVIQGAYLVAVVFVGAILGAGAALVKDFTKGLGCLLGGFAVSMWILTLVAGGTIQDTGGKSILVALISTAAWALSFSRFTRDYSLIGFTSFAGATAFALGIDCFTRAGLKEFWLYIWNVNPNLFPSATYTYPITRGMLVETISIPILATFGVVSQLRLWRVIRDRRRAKDADQEAEERRRDTVEELRGLYIRQDTRDARAQWEKNYDSGNESRQSVLLSPHSSARTLSYSMPTRQVTRDGSLGRGSVSTQTVTPSRFSSTATSASARSARANGSVARDSRPNNYETAGHEDSPKAEAVTATEEVRDSRMSVSSQSVRLAKAVVGQEDDEIALLEETSHDPEEFRRPVAEALNLPESDASRTAEPSERLTNDDPTETHQVAARDLHTDQDGQDPALPADMMLNTKPRPSLSRVSSLPAVDILMDRSRDQRSSTGDQSSSVQNQDLVRKTVSLRSLQTSNRYVTRNSSMPIISQTLVESPIETDMPLQSPPRVPPLSQPQVHVDERELRRQSALRTISSPLPARQVPQRYQSTLCIPKPEIRISSADGNTVRILHTASADYNTPGRRSTLPSPINHRYIAPQPSVSRREREATLAELRASIRRESTAVAHQQTQLEMRREEMMKEKKQSREILQQQKTIKQYRDSTIESAMRRSDMQTLHREAMRKLQAQANKHL